MTFTSVIAKESCAECYQIVEQFFRAANEAAENFDAPETGLGALMTSFVATEVQSPAVLPIHAPLEYPFDGQTQQQIIDYAQSHLDGSDLSSRNLVILDTRSMIDLTCLLISLSEESEPFGPVKRQILRSDFESSLISLNAKEMGCAGDDMLETDYEGFDGILRGRIKDEAQYRQTHESSRARAS